MVEVSAAAAAHLSSKKWESGKPQELTLNEFSNLFKGNLKTPICFPDFLCDILQGCKSSSNRSIKCCYYGGRDPGNYKVYIHGDDKKEQCSHQTLVRISS